MRKGRRVTEMLFRQNLILPNGAPTKCHMARFGDRTLYRIKQGQPYILTAPVFSQEAAHFEVEAWWNVGSGAAGFGCASSPPELPVPFFVVRRLPSCNPGATYSKKNPVLLLTP